jgi:hypothetical protein
MNAIRCRIRTPSRRCTRKLRRAVRARRHCPTDHAVLKLPSLVLNLAAELFEDHFAII